MNRDEVLRVAAELDQLHIFTAIDARGMAARLRAAVEGGGWRTMESAPTKRREFFLVAVDGAVLMAHWLNGHVWAEGTPDDPPYDRPITPTHWMPLPPPPVGPKGEG